MTVASHPYAVTRQIWTDTIVVSRAATFAGALLAYAGTLREFPTWTISIINEDNLDIDDNGNGTDGLTDMERDAVEQAIIIVNGALAAEVESIDEFAQTATVRYADRVVIVSFGAEHEGGDEWIVNLDGSECVEIFDNSEAPEGSLPAEGWEGCSTYPALLSDGERSAVEMAIIERLQDERRDQEEDRGAL